MARRRTRRASGPTRTMITGAGTAEETTPEQPTEQPPAPAGEEPPAPVVTSPAEDDEKPKKRRHRT